MGNKKDIEKDLSLLRRYFDGNYSLNDYSFIQKSLGDKIADPEVKRLVNLHWDEFIQEGNSQENVEHILFRINHEIRTNENKQTKQYRILRTFQRIAAILILPITLAFLTYLYFQPHEYETAPASFAEIQCPHGVKTKFELPDGSTGFLNSGSKLRYPVNFNTREVELVGEAFFDVIHNEQSPFSVNTKNLEIKVLGTTFNVIAYDEEVTEEVILQSGKVDVYSKGGKKLETLIPNQQLALNVKNKKFSTSNVDASSYTSWKDGILIFRNENMKQVARRLGRWYNANIIIADPKLEDYTYHATFVDEQLDQVMKMISLTSPVVFIEEDVKNSAENIYKKRNIILRSNPDRIDDFE